jgi:hypothetical protein
MMAGIKDADKDSGVAGSTWNLCILPHGKKKSAVQGVTSTRWGYTMETGYHISHIHTPACQI